MRRRRAVAVAYVVAPGVLGALGVVTGNIGVLVAGLVLGLPLSYVGYGLAFLAAAILLDPTDEGPRAAALASVLIATAFSGAAAIQVRIARALLGCKGRAQTRG